MGTKVVEGKDEMAATGDGGNHIIASQADREQVLDALKAAFVQGRLTKEEFDQRVGHVLATYAELDALTADLPARPTQTRLPEPARESHNRKVIQRGTAAGAGASMAFTAAMFIVAGGKPAVALIVVPVVGFVVTVVLAGLLTLLSWVLEKGSSRQPSQGPPTGSSAKAPQRLASADSVRPRSQTDHDPRHMAAAARGRYVHLPTPGAAVQDV